MFHVKFFKKNEFSDHKPYKRLMQISIVALAIGMIGFADRAIFSHQHTNYGSAIPWGLWVAAYIYFVGLSAGSFLLSALIYVFNIKKFERIGRLALLTALVTLIGGLIAIWVDLGHMSRAWRLLIFPNFQSVMAWVVYFYGAYVILLGTEMYIVMRRDEQKLSEKKTENDHKIIKALAITGIPLAIAFHGGVGALFGVVGAQSGWHSGLYPIYFLISALVSGTAVLTGFVAVFGAGKGSDEHKSIVKTLSYVVMGLLVFDLLLEASEILITLYGAIPSHTGPVKIMLFGNFWWMFWVVHLLLGSLAPIALMIKNRASDVKITAIACFMIALAFMAVRVNLVIPSLATPHWKSLPGAFYDQRITWDYFPSMAEFSVLIGIFGLCGILYYLGMLYLPITKGASK